MRSENPPRRRARRRSRRGFSIVEALVAAAVLGIGLVALVKLHQSAMRGMKASRSIGIASDIALQAAEELTTVPMAQLNAALGGVGCPTAGGCRNGNSPLALDFAAAKPAPCTLWVSDGLMKDRTGVVPAGATATTEAAGQAAAMNFRIDRVVMAHPNGAQHPNTNVIQVFVCWRDEQGYVKQVMTERMVSQ